MPTANPRSLTREDVAQAIDADLVMAGLRSFDDGAPNILGMLTNEQRHVIVRVASGAAWRMIRFLNCEEGFVIADR